jgi:hypothetical protein
MTGLSARGCGGVRDCQHIPNENNHTATAARSGRRNAFSFQLQICGLGIAARHILGQSTSLSRAREFE